jgi:hypothetical protein
LPILARILKDRGVVTERQLQQAIQHQVLYGGRLGTSLFELGFITEERLQEALAKATGATTTAIDPREIKPETVKLISKDIASRYKVFPYRLKGKTLFLLMVDPSDHGTVARVSYSLGYIVKPLVVPELRMVQLLRDHYGVDETWRFTDTHRQGKAAKAPAPDPAQAPALLEAALTRDEVVEAAVAMWRRTFRRVILFIVREPWVVGWTGAGEGMDRALAATLRIPLDVPSVFRTVTRDRAPFIGRLGPEDENRRFLEAIGKRPQTNAAIVPVVVRGRVVNLVFADNGAGGNVKADLGDLLVEMQKVPRAYLRIIRKRVAETRKATGANPGTIDKDIE